MIAVNDDSGDANNLFVTFLTKSESQDAASMDVAYKHLTLALSLTVSRSQPIQKMRRHAVIANLTCLILGYYRGRQSAGPSAIE